MYIPIDWKPDPRLLTEFQEFLNESPSNLKKDILETNNKNGFLYNQCSATHNGFVDSWEEYIKKFSEE